MPGTPTTRMGLATMLGTDLGQTIDNTHDAAMATLDAEGVMFSQGVLASRPTSTSGSPGKAGRFYYATDVVKLYYDFGTGWSEVLINPASRGLTATAGNTSISSTAITVPGMSTAITVSPGQAVECAGMAYLQIASSTGAGLARWKCVDGASAVTVSMSSPMSGASVGPNNWVLVPVFGRFVPATAGSCTISMEAYTGGGYGGLVDGDFTQGFIHAR